LRWHGKHLMARANNSQRCITKRRLRRSWSLQFYVRDLRPP